MPKIGRHAVEYGDSDDLPGEVWRIVPSLNGYDASNLGRIRACVEMQMEYFKPKKRKNNQRRIKIYSIVKMDESCVIVPYRSKRSGYFIINVWNHQKKQPTSRTVGSLVNEAFHGPCPKYISIYLDGNVENNQETNLKWGLRSEAAGLALIRGTRTQKLTDEQVAQIKTRLEDGAVGAELAREFKVAKSMISAIKNGKKRANVTIPVRVKTP